VITVGKRTMRAMCPGPHHRGAGRDFGDHGSDPCWASAPRWRGASVARAVSVEEAPQVGRELAIERRQLLTECGAEISEAIIGARVAAETGPIQRVPSGLALRGRACGFYREPPERTCVPPRLRRTRATSTCVSPRARVSPWKSKTGPGPTVPGSSGSGSIGPSCLERTRERQGNQDSGRVDASI
jgi:hypothetical protein